MKPQIQNKIDSLKSLHYAFQSFRMSWKNLGHANDALSQSGIDPSEFFPSSYPFDLSFDEINIDAWVNENTGLIEREIEALELSDKTGYNLEQWTNSETATLYGESATSYRIVDENGNHLYIAFVWDLDANRKIANTGKWVLNYSNASQSSAILADLKSSIEEAFQSVYGYNEVQRRYLKMLLDFRKTNTDDYDDNANLLEAVRKFDKILVNDLNDWAQEALSAKGQAIIREHLKVN